jgi:hypothetical protein
MIFFICVGKSTFVRLTLLMLNYGSPLSKRCCRCAGIVLQNGCHVVNRVTDVCGESVIHGITSEISRQLAGCVCVCVCVCARVNIKWFTSVKEVVFCKFDLAYLPCCLHPPPPIFPETRRITRKTRCGLYGCSEA